MEATMAGMMMAKLASTSIWEGEGGGGIAAHAHVGIMASSHWQFPMSMSYAVPEMGPSVRSRLNWVPPVTGSSSPSMAHL